jgi:hypothetical protein
VASAQLNMFAEAEAELFAPQPVVARPDADRVRKRLATMLANTRDASVLDDERRRYLEKVVPQMSLALPEEERRQVQLAFDAELERLG